MELTVWGARGSIPVSGPEYVRYGGDTTCVEVRGPAGTLLIDAGTGMRRAGERLHAAGEPRPSTRTPTSCRAWA